MFALLAVVAGVFGFSGMLADVSLVGQILSCVAAVVSMVCALLQVIEVKDG